jgi:RNA polymerase sigma factor (TIGR02999 family)
VDALPPDAVTELLARWGSGDEEALRRLIPIVYPELYKLSSAFLQREHSKGQPTMNATGLVNEVYLRLAGICRTEFQNRTHFYGAAATIIRRILVDRSRARRAEKRRGVAVELGETALISDAAGIDYLDLHNALDRLESLDARKSKIVELRYFAGLSIEQVAEILEISPITVKREWRFARTWLYEQVSA